MIQMEIGWRSGGIPNRVKSVHDAKVSDLHKYRGRGGVRRPWRPFRFAKIAVDAEGPGRALSSSTFAEV